MNPDERVLCIPRERFLDWSDGGFSGFVPIATAEDRLDLEVNLLGAGDAGWLPRSLCETDPAFKQVVPYVVVRRGARVLCYRRGKAGGEGRLHGRLSIGFGGHVNAEDAVGSDVRATIYSAAARELDEEGGFRGGRINPIGVVNDESDAVSAVHLGIVFEARPEVGRWSFAPEIGDPGYYYPETIVPEACEAWSRHVLEYLIAGGSRVIPLEAEAR